MKNKIIPTDQQLQWINDDITSKLQKKYNKKSSEYELRNAFEFKEDGDVLWFCSVNEFKFINGEERCYTSDLIVKVKSNGNKEPYYVEDAYFTTHGFPVTSKGLFEVDNYGDIQHIT